MSRRRSHKMAARSAKAFGKQFVQLEPRENPASAFALAGGSLVAFDTANPGAALAPVALTGINTGETLAALDVRPQNGGLYALGINPATDTGSLYFLSPRTGIATVVGTAGSVSFQDAGGALVDLPDPATTTYDIDFNPTVDRIRVVAGSLNFRVNPNTGGAIDGDLGGAAGSVANTNTDGPISGLTTNVNGTAYTNNAQNATATTQYTLDPTTDSLYIQNPPNAGTQTNAIPLTLGGAPADVTAVGGFDIQAGVTVAASNAVAAGNGFAVLTVGGTSKLYTVDLTTGALTSVGAINGVTAATSLAVASDQGGLPAVGLGAGGLTLTRFNTDTPATGVTVTIAGVATGETLVGIDYRPATGQLYGLGVDPTTDKATLYLIDPQTKDAMSLPIAKAIAVGTAAGIQYQDGAGTVVELPDPVTAGYGFDFNPTVDKIRVTTSTGLNFRVNPVNGTAVDGDLGGAAGSVANTNTDGGINGLPTGSTGVSATGYTNSFAQPAAAKATTQYTLDAGSDSLFIQSNPNAGVQALVAQVKVAGAAIDFTDVNGFDVPAGVTVAASGDTAAGDAYALLTVGAVTSLYAIDLTTGEAVILGASPTALTGLSVGDAPAGTVAFTGASFSGTEGKSVDLTLTRTDGSTGAVTVTVNFAAGTAGGADYTTTPITVTFADGATTAKASVPLTADMLTEGTETFTATLAAPTGGAVIGAAGTATVTILDAQPQTAGGVAFALSNNGIITLDLANPANALAPVPVTGLATGDTLVGIDVRPLTGTLYGLGYNATAGTVQLYAISPRTGVATAVGSVGTFVDAGGATVRVGVNDLTAFGFDFNPTVDRIRVVNSNGQNFRLNPNTGAAVDGDLGMATPVTGLNMDGALNGGSNTADATAYTNSAQGGAITTQYVLDAATDKLFIQSPPNKGTLTGSLAVTVGGSALDFTAVNGFDIPGSVNTVVSGTGVPAGFGFASLTVGGSSKLYQIDLTSGAATLVGTVRDGTAPVQGLALATEGTANAAAGLPAVALSADGLSLIRFSTGTPGTTSAPLVITGVAAGETLVGIDFRPATGQLYGLGVNETTDKATLYILDPFGKAGTTTAVAVGAAGSITFVDGTGATVDLPAASAGYGIDFNPAVDKLRVTTGTGLNFRVNPADGMPVDGNLNNTTTPPAGTNPDAPVTGLPTGSTGVTAVAYTNSFGGATKTTQYVLDAGSDKLFIQNPPNAGTQTGGLAITVGGSAIDFTAVNGFDIPGGVSVATSGNAAVGTGFAVLTVGGTTSLYSIDLATGAATVVGPVGTGAGGLAGLAIGGDTAAGTSVVSFTAAAFSKAETGGTVDLTLTRTGNTTGEVTVTVTLTNGTATSGTDFSGGPFTVTFADGQSTATVSVPIVNDSDLEADETFTASLTAVNGVAAVGATPTATVTITNDDGNPAVNIGNVSVTEGNAGTTVAMFTVTLSGASTQTVTVQFTVAGVTASAGTDFTASNGTLTFAPGETSKTIMVTVNGDLVLEPDETFTVTLSAPTNAILGPSAVGTGTIVNDDAAPTLSIGNVSVTEGNTGTTTATFTVTLSAPSSQPVTVMFASASGTATSGTDFAAASGTLTFAPGVTSQTISVTVNGDTTAEPNETFNVTLTNPTGGATLGTAVGTGTITNDDGAVTTPVVALVGVPQFAAAADAGGDGKVTVFNANKSPLFTFTPFAGFTGGVRVAVADFNGDGVPDVAAGTGPGRATSVVLVDGATQKTIFTVAPFEAAFTGGVFVAAGDVDGDGKADLIITPDQGGGPRVDVYSGAGFDKATKLASFFAFQDDPNFRGGARAATGDVNGDGRADVVVSAGFGGGPRVATFDGKSVAAGSSNPTRLFNDFFAFENTLRNGVFITVGDLDGDGKADLIAGGGPGGGPRVTGFSAADLISSGGGKQTFLTNFFGGDTANRGGIRVAVKNLDNDTKADLVVGSGTGGGTRVTGYLGTNLTPTATAPATAFDFDLVSGSTFGVFVG